MPPQAGEFGLRVVATDPAAATAERLIVIGVANVTPVVTVSGASAIPEGGRFVGSGSFTDPGANVWTATVDYDDGTGPQPLALSLDHRFTLDHVYANSGDFTIAVSVADGTTTGVGSLALAVTNVAPTGTVVNSGPVTEGVNTTATITVTASDVSPADAANLHYTYDFGNGTFGTTTTANVVTVPVGYLTNGPAVHRVRVRVIDPDGDFTELFTDIVVYNAPPTADPGPDRLGRVGQPNTFAANATDPGNDIASIAWTVLSGGATVANGSGPSFAFTPVLAGPYTVRLHVTDADGASVSREVTLTVRPTAPTGTLSNSGPVDEGASATVTLTPADAARDLRYAFDFDNDGTFDLGNGTFGGSVTANTATLPATLTAAGPATRTVRVRVIDAESQLTDYTTDVVVRNVAPVIAVAPAATLAEGGTLALAGSFADPGADVWTATVDYGDGTGTHPLSLAANKTFALAHTYPNSGSYSLVVTISDGAATTTATILVRVANVAPVGSLTNSGPVDEGGTATVTAAGSDVSPADAGSLRYAYDFGDDGTFDLGDGSFAGSVTTTTTTVPAALLAAGPAAVPVRVRVIDPDGGYTEAVISIAVRNVRPVVSAGGNLALSAGTYSFSRGGSFADPGADTWTATVDYGDGTGVQPLALNPDKTFALAHTYAAAGTFTVVVAVADGVDTGTGSFAVTVPNAVPTITTFAPTPGTIDENGTVAVNGTFTDAAQVTHTVVIGWGDGTPSTTVSLMNGERSFTATHRYVDNPAGQPTGAFTVTATVSNGTGSASAATAVTVRNVAPTAALGNNGPVNEANPATATVSFTNVTDPSSADTAAGFHYSFAASSAGLAAAYALAGTAASKAFTYTDSGTYTVYGRVFDKDNGATDYTTTVTVTNVTPTAAGVSGPTALPAGGTGVYALTGVFDPSPVDTAGLHFGFALSAGGLPATYAAAGPTNSFAVNFPAYGTYTVYARVYDKDGGVSGTQTRAVSVAGQPGTAALINGDLYVYGTAAADTVFVNPSGTQIRVQLNGTTLGTYPVTGKVWVYANDGNDAVTVDAAVTLPTALFGEAGNDTLRGGGGPDRLDGGAGADSLAGNAGDDTALGGAGNDTLDGGAGNDSLDAGDGDNTVWAGAGNDTVLAGAGNDSVTGDDGDDSISVGDGRNTVYAGLGNDTVITGTGDDKITGDDGNDSITAGDGRNTVYGGAGNDSITAGAGNDSVTGDDGDDSIAAGDGNNTVYAGGGNDTVATGTGNDSITGDDGNDSITAGAGNDTVWGGAGNDTIDGGLGYGDSIGGGDGDDVITDPDGVAYVSGGTGADTITLTFAAGWTLGGSVALPAGAITGGAGNDAITVTTANAAMTFEVTGDDGDDAIELHGTWKKVKVYGGAGNDTARIPTAVPTTAFDLNGVEVLVRIP